MIQTLKNGWSAIASNSKLWLILVLILVFPAVYLFSYYQIQSATYKNLETVQLGMISASHDLLESLILNNLSTVQVLESITNRFSNVKKLQIAKKDGEKLIVVYDLNKDLIGTEIESSASLRISFINPGESFTFSYEIEGKNIKQAFREVVVEGVSFYIFTEHDFSSLYNRIKNREVSTYSSIAVIFLFVLALAYWMVRQINYELLLKKANREISERDLFTNSLAHELRAPLTSMRGYASMIEESKEVNQTDKEYAKRISQSTARLVLLINDFLEAARIQSGKLQISKVKTDLRDIINSIASNSIVTAKKKGLNFVTEIPEGDIIALTDGKRLEQVLTNLVSNAIKYTEKGTVTLKLSLDVKYANITVADTGGGINAEDQKKLFQPFVRVGDSSSQASVTGTGLGMWITKRLIEQLDGSIGLESIKNVGTHVVVKIPRA